MRSKLRTEVAAGRVSADFTDFLVEGLWRGIDPKHVLWRLERELRKLSWDSDTLAACTNLLFTMFNYHLPGDAADDDDDDVEAPRQQALACETVPTCPEEAMQCFMQNERMKGDLSLGENILAAHAAGELVRAGDNIAMPVTAVRVMLRWLGLPKLATRWAWSGLRSPFVEAPN